MTNPFSGLGGSAQSESKYASPSIDNMDELVQFVNGGSDAQQVHNQPNNGNNNSGYGAHAGAAAGEFGPNHGTKQDDDLWRMLQNTL